LYPEKTEAGAGKEGEAAALVPTPGLTLLVTLPTSPVRAVYTATNGQLFAVGGNKFYSIDSSFVATDRGTLGTVTGQVSMADNGIQIAIVDGSATGYTWTLGSNTFAAITDTDFPGANQVTFQDGYFIFNKPDSGQFFISGLNDTTIDPLDFATSEGNPDQVVGLISVHRDLWVFNEQTTEVFYDSGDAGFPFERIQGAFLEVGLGARFSIARNATSVFWLGKDTQGSGIVYTAQGYTPQRISTHAVEAAIQSYSSVSDAVGFCYQEEGHSFYVLNFPTANTTWVFDATTGYWHERTYNNLGAIERHRANCHTFAFGKHIVGDYANGKIYQLTTDALSDDGVEIIRERTLPHVTAGLKRVFYSSFQLDLETGVGIDGTGQGTDPQIMLQFSDDGGHSWSNEKWTAMGKIGARKRRAIWRRLGASRDRVFRVRITDPVKVIIMGAEINLEPGAA